MRFVEIEKKHWPDFISRLHANSVVFGPVKTGKYFEFEKLSKNQVPALEYSNTRLSPKALVYPQSEIMFEYTLDKSREDHDILKEPEKDYQPKTIVGIRPCDVKAFVLVRKNFDTPEYRDPYWIRSYESMTMVAMACNQPCSTCFCTSAGCGPYHEEGTDILLVDKGETLLAKIVTEKGEQLAQNIGWESNIDTEDADTQIQDLRQKAEEKIVSHIRTDQLEHIDTVDLYNAPFWEDIAFSCINCGTCTYSCPTCWCFDIQDEIHGNCGVRMRNWDSCMYPLFTLHGSGHNPRGTKLHRVRQRFMHKLKYFVDKYESGIQCVGCGRCVRLCPVNIDIRKVCDLMNGYQPGDEPACAVTG